MRSRRFIGLDLRATEVRVASLLKRWRRRALLMGRQVLPMPCGMLAGGQPQGIDEKLPALAASLHDAVLPLAGKEQRVALSLPDSWGYVLVLDIDSFSRSRREGKEVVAWQLGHLLPGQEDLQFDYQVLRRGAGGAARLLVVVMKRDILNRFGALLQQAGLVPDYVGFYGLNLYRHWRYRLDPEGDAVLVSLNEDGVILQAYQDGILAYYRARATGAGVGLQVNELHRIVAGRGKEFFGRGRSRVFLHSDSPVTSDTEDALNDCFGRRIQVLEGHAGSPADFAAAIGAAECMMMGG